MLYLSFNRTTIKKYVQAIKAENVVCSSDVVGDTVRVYQQDNWEINFNLKTGAFESWQVVCLL